MSEQTEGKGVTRGDMDLVRRLREDADEVDGEGVGTGYGALMREAADAIERLAQGGGGGEHEGIGAP